MDELTSYESHCRFQMAVKELIVLETEQELNGSCLSVDIPTSAMPQSI